jgi:hypothetical protein
MREFLGEDKSEMYIDKTMIMEPETYIAASGVKTVTPIVTKQITVAFDTSALESITAEDVAAKLRIAMKTMPELDLEAEPYYNDAVLELYKIDAIEKILIAKPDLEINSIGDTSNIVELVKLSQKVVENPAMPIDESRDIVKEEIKKETIVNIKDQYIEKKNASGGFKESSTKNISVLDQVVNYIYSQLYKK